ncbi:MAG: phosphatidate cytidylyltransferase [Candidatus Omnitrophota bacterium]
MDSIISVPFKNRVITAILLIALVAGVVFFVPEFIYAAMVVFLTSIGLYEFYSLIEKKGILIYKYFGIAVGALIPLSIYFRFESTKGWELLFIATATLIFFILQFVRKDSSQAIIGISTTLFGIFYVSWFFSFLIKIKFLDSGTQLVAFLLAVTKMGDIGAYIIGSNFGKRILISRISPKKTLEGALGGFVFSVLTAIMLGMFYIKFIPLIHLIALGILLGIIAQLGDLCESLIKRDCGVKDSGNYFPGLGGVLDIIDSVIFTSPIFYYYILHFNIV